MNSALNLQTGNISTINSTIQNINSSVSSLTNRVTTLENSAGDNEDLTALQGQITLLTSSISSINSTMQNVVTRLNASSQGTDYDLLYSMFSVDENINFGYTGGLKAGDSISINTAPYNRLKIYARLNTLPAQIDVKIKDTIKDEFLLSAIPSTFTGIYFLKAQLTSVKTRFMVLKYCTFTFGSDGTVDIVQGTAHANFYIYRIEGYQKTSE